MKKAKVIIMVIAVFAIVGGALAFKARILGNTDYCFAITNVQPGFAECTYQVMQRSARPRLPGEPVVYYTTTDDTDWCFFADCPNVGIPDQQ
jgi:hypothetical protein